MKKLQAAGLVDARRKQYYTIDILRRETFESTISALIFQLERKPRVMPCGRKYTGARSSVRSCRTAIANHALTGKKAHGDL